MRSRRVLLVSRPRAVAQAENFAIEEGDLAPLADSDAVWPRLATGARVVICGTASISAWDPWPTGPRLERHLLVKRARAQGFVVFDHADRWEASVARLADWVRAGTLRYAEDILQGVESCPDALAGLYRGENKGKRLIRLTG
jgi:NADPH-dependent curcumin reductase